MAPDDPMRGTWVVKDPVSLRFFLFGADEVFLLQRLDGTRSERQLIDEFARLRAPQQITASRLRAFLSQLYREGLASSDAAGQGPRLIERAERRRQHEAFLRSINLLAIKLPGFNPDALISALHTVLRWLFSRSALLAAALVCGVGAAIAVAELDTLLAEWPRMGEFLSGWNLALLAVALALTKGLHELAHALTCKHFGGRCHEMGVLLLALTPCLYCDVTDAWMLRQRWQRIAISAAGILLELFLAASAIIVWRYTQPGPLHSACLSIIFVCSVSTLLFNGNPLLKYDGYYILSDMLRIPNLWHESRAYVGRRLGQWLLGHQQTVKSEPLHRQAFLAVYAFASSLYRLVLMFTILFLVHQAMHPHGLDLVTLLLAISIGAVMSASWFASVNRWWCNLKAGGRVPKARLALIATTGVLIIGFVYWMPFSCSIGAPAVLRTHKAARVYVATPGVLTDAVGAGESVTPGTVLARLENAKLEAEVLRLRGELSRMATRAETLDLRLGDEADAAGRLLVIQEVLADLEEQLRLRELEQRSLVIRAPAGGTVISPDPKAGRPSAETDELPYWTGTPLAPENTGSYLNRGDLLCLVGNPHACEAVVYVDEADVALVRVGQSARLRLNHELNETITGRVAEIAEINADSTPNELLAVREIEARVDGEGRTNPIRTAYQVRIELDASGPQLLIGARGWASIDVAPQTLVQRLVRWFGRTLTISPRV